MHTTAPQSDEGRLTALVAATHATLHRQSTLPALNPLNLCSSTPASDVYSLGASLFTLLFGTIPFPATSIAELYEALHTQDLVIPSEPALGEGVRQLLRGCMERVRGDRWCQEGD